RDQYSARKERPLLSYSTAYANRLRTNWIEAPPLTPSFIGRRAIDVPLTELIPFIDWTFFFAAWELKGRFPAILDHPQHGAAARELYDNARTLLDRIVNEKLLQARGAYGFWPAVSDGDDVVLFEDEGRAKEIARFPMLRQQELIADGKANLSLADYVADRASGVRDYVGAFAVTAGIGAEALAHRFEREHDDYNAILVKALADRFAEAFAAYLHAKSRTEWGISESLTQEDLAAERHRGIRPGFGYPACPDHSEKFTLFNLLQAPAVGIELTESAAMTPAASVSGLYFAHPQARYFMVGRLGEDQIADYAKRKGLPTAEVERWLGSSLAYEPTS
ncbi:MAG: vitamin B12 dependent-methionine synthase activation domain-containing protein, partial [Vicinamibacterales bacterium]